MIIVATNAAQLGKGKTEVYDVFLPGWSVGSTSWGKELESHVMGKSCELLSWKLWTDYMDVQY